MATALASVACAVVPGAQVARSHSRRALRCFSAPSPPFPARPQLPWRSQSPHCLGRAVSGRETFPTQSRQHTPHGLWGRRHGRVGERAKPLGAAGIRWGSKSQAGGNIAEDGFDPSTSGLWAQHAPAAPLCWGCLPPCLCHPLASLPGSQHLTHGGPALPFFSSQPSPSRRLPTLPAQAKTLALFLVAMQALDTDSSGAQVEGRPFLSSARARLVSLGQQVRAFCLQAICFQDLGPRGRTVQHASTAHAYSA